MIRKADPQDVPQVVELVASILSKEFPSDQSAYATDDLSRLMETYAEPQNTFLVAEEGPRIVGTCGVKADGSEAAILRRLFVSPDCRGKGVGQALLEAALRFCREKGFREVIIRTSTRMEQAIRLCRSLGFQEDGSWAMGEVTLIRFRLRLT
ncbi:MAG: GNAT family N-acetyltransferase [Candidatus Omnitrophica bacterium]|nr:GNAT family N-acetyltransferase [Candidatus Omnitrophota bacterium]